MEKHGCTERKYATLRRRLDELGYHQPLSFEALILVEKLLNDLLHTTDRLSQYKNSWQKVHQEYGDLKTGVGPYVAENEKLIQECKYMQSKLLQQLEDADKAHQKFKSQLRTLKNENSNLSFLNSEYILKIRTLEKGIAERNHRIIQLQNENVHAVIISGGSSKIEPKRKQPKLEIDKAISSNKEWKDTYLSATSQVKDPYVINMVSVADDKIESLAKELERVNYRNEDLQEINTSLRRKVIDQEKEIFYLKHKTYTQMHCSKCTDNNEPVMGSRKTHPDNVCDIKSLQKINKELKEQLKEALEKQHEAMEQAVKLADRNRDLEKELHDIDHMALAVETECKLSLKENSDKVSKIQDRLESSLIQIHELEQEILELKHKNVDLKKEVDERNKERSQSNADVALAGKKKEVERLNENVSDLTQKVEQLSHTIRSQKQRILELESKILENAGSWKKDEGLSNPSRNTERHKWDGKTSENTESHGGAHSVEKVCVAFTDSCSKPESGLQWKELVEMESHAFYDAGELFDDGNRLESLSGTSSEGVERERSNSEVSLKIMTVKVHGAERSEGEARNDARRLEEELSALRRQLQLETELHENEKAKLEKALSRSEELIQKLQAEQRELSSGHGSLRSIVRRHESTISKLEDSLKSCQSDYQREKNLNSQLKTLQEQTERALIEAQTKMTQLAGEQNVLQERLKGSESSSLKMDKETRAHKLELGKLRDSLVQLDREKDSLLVKIDEKTERIVGLEGELKSKKSQISNLELTIAEMNKKLDITVDESVVRDHEKRNLKQEIDRLRQELSVSRTQKENALRENRRIQDDLASVTNAYRINQRELEDSRREVEDLKLQLQGYVDEVRRIEELLAQKEEERNDLLEQFRSLSAEASVLESTNHSLESETTDARMQLRLMNERMMDLERQLDDSHSLITGYEQQITTLTRQVATFEMQFRSHEEHKSRLEADLTACRGLCRKLESQKEQLMERVSNTTADKATAEKEASQMRKDLDRLESAVESNKERMSSLESRLLSKEKECLEEQMTNEALKREIQRLQENILELERKLEKEMAAVDKYEKNALEIGHQLDRMEKDPISEVSVAVDEKEDDDLLIRLDSPSNSYFSG